MWSEIFLYLIIKLEIHIFCILINCNISSIYTGIKIAKYDMSVILQISYSAKKIRNYSDTSWESILALKYSAP